jgi:hypothetical protein
MQLKEKRLRKRLPARLIPVYSGPASIKKARISSGRLLVSLGKK